MAYASWSVVYGETPSASKWNILGTNDASFNDGTGIGSGAIARTSLATTTRSVSLNGTHTGAASSGTTIIVNTMMFRVPDDYVSGNVLIKGIHRNTVGSGVVVLRLDAYRFRNGTAFVALASVLAVNRTVATTDSVDVTELTISSSDIQANDSIWFSLQRNGSDGADTNTGIEDIDGVWIEYTGRV
jgi:hypothetical protein